MINQPRAFAREEELRDGALLCAGRLLDRRQVAENGFRLIDKALSGKPYLAARFSIAHASLFFVEFWTARRLGVNLPANCAAHFDRMLARSAGRRAIEQVGLE